MASAIRSLAMSRQPSSRTSASTSSPLSAASCRCSSTSRSRARRGAIGIPNRAGSSRPSSRLTSVSVSGPPAPYAAGPGRAPALWGPTCRRPFSTRQMEPPPAATVSIASAGATSRASPTWCSKTYSKSPSNRATSVLVPPMSKLITRSYPAPRPTRAAPATPPAGPESRLSLAWKEPLRSSPPALVITCSRSPSRPPCTRSRYPPTTGPRYASTTAVSARGSSLMNGASAAEPTTCSNPISRRKSASCSSCSGFR